jgi:hypothetical protein
MYSLFVQSTQPRLCFDPSLTRGPLGSRFMQIFENLQCIALVPFQGDLPD